ncbi:MAG: hypothetical protein MUO60_14575 [Clostridiaceae bacterium]|jgi:hypothetical protein|nr:hypothetical protein [Clostridiaceae bacterium]|tara:strand:- start:277 stop:828 length:552 start_codon:yes stop_codon:yes gene_type:complete
MADKHILSLEIPTVSNCGLLCIKDTSQYSSELAVDCEELLITLPGFSVPVLIKVNKGFDMCLTACILALQKIECGTVQQDIPDGIYVIRYSVSPNLKVYVEYNHLRVTALLTSYYKVLCQLNVQACQPESQKQALLSEMSFIKTIIDAAVANAEYCQSSAQAMQLYNYAKQRLSKINCPTGNC